MPLIKMQTNVGCPKEKKDAMVKKLSKICASCTGKPEAYVMVVLETDSTIAMGGEIRLAAFLEVKGIGGLTPEVNKKISADICALLQSEMKIGSESVYINFTDVPAKNWGWNSGTFG